jgi:hypothetical protein
MVTPLLNRCLASEFRQVRMPYRLLRFGLSRKHPEPRMFTRYDSLKAGPRGSGAGLQCEFRGAAARLASRDHDAHDRVAVFSYTGVSG